MSVNVVGPNMQIPPNERSVTPLLREIVDQSRGYVPNGYQPLYYGGELSCHFMDYCSLVTVIDIVNLC